MCRLVTSMNKLSNFIVLTVVFKNNICERFEKMTDLAPMPTSGVCMAKGEDDVDDITVFGDVGAEPPLGIWNRAADILRSCGLEYKMKV